MRKGHQVQDSTIIGEVMKRSIFSMRRGSWDRFLCVFRSRCALPLYLFLVPLPQDEFGGRDRHLDSDRSCLGIVAGPGALGWLLAVSRKTELRAGQHSSKGLWRRFEAEESGSPGGRHLTNSMRLSQCNTRTRVVACQVSTCTVKPGYPAMEGWRHAFISGNSRACRAQSRCGDNLLRAYGRACLHSHRQLLDHGCG